MVSRERIRFSKPSFLCGGGLGYSSPGLARPAGSLITSVFRSHRTNARFLEKLIRSISQTAETKYVARKKVTLELKIPEGISLRGRCVRMLVDKSQKMMTLVKHRN